jgi:hypothetical protein
MTPERFDDQLRELWDQSPDGGPARTAALHAFRAAPIRLRSRRRRRAALAAAAVAVAVAAGGGTVAAAQDALPGDTTYGVKLALERAEVGLARGDSAEAEAWLRVAETRVEEAVRAGAEGRYDALPEIVTGYRSAVAEVRDRLSGLPAGTELPDRAAHELDTHQQVLAGLVDVVPAPAQDALRRALDSASQGGAPDQVPPVVPGPSLDRSPDGPPPLGPPDGRPDGDEDAGPPAEIPGGPGAGNPGDAPPSAPSDRQRRAPTGEGLEDPGDGPGDSGPGVPARERAGRPDSAEPPSPDPSPSVPAEAEKPATDPYP